MSQRKIKDPLKLSKGKKAKLKKIAEQRLAKKIAEQRASLATANINMSPSPTASIQ